jgi:hypothetical protein
MENQDETRMPASRHYSPPIRRKTNSRGQQGRESFQSGDEDTDERNTDTIDESVVMLPAIAISTDQERRLSQREET